MQYRTANGLMVRGNATFCSAAYDLGDDTGLTFELLAVSSAASISVVGTLEVSNDLENWSHLPGSTLTALTSAPTRARTVVSGPIYTRYVRGRFVNSDPGRCMIRGTINTVRSP